VAYATAVQKGMSANQVRQIVAKSDSRSACVDVGYVGIEVDIPS
jgi:hypothetical protein